MSWGLLGVLMVVGMQRMAFVLYVPIDGAWAKWNVEAILAFGNPFDLSPYNMLAGMGSVYSPNLPWLNPGALALWLPVGEPAKKIVSYSIYAAELGGSLVLLARTMGFSWLTANIAAQLYLYLLFPPFSEVFSLFGWFSVAPYFAHLVATLNCALSALTGCGRYRRWEANAALLAAFVGLFAAGLISAPFTFLFATPAYIVIGTAMIPARAPHRAELTWKLAAVAACLLAFLSAGLPGYYLGTIATVARTPQAAIAWSKLLSLKDWLELLSTHPLCATDPRLLLCFGSRAAWFDLAALLGAVLAIFASHPGIRAAAWTLIVYIGATHLYAYAHQARWLGVLSVFSPHFLLMSCWPFMTIFAASAAVDPLRLLVLRRKAGAEISTSRKLLHFCATVAVVAILVVIVIALLRNPYVFQHYRAVQLFIAAAAFCIAGFAVAALHGFHLSARLWRRTVILSVFPILALVHLSLGVERPDPSPLQPSLREYLRDHASVELGQRLRGYTATVWTDDILPALGASADDKSRYISGREQFRNWYGETFTETDLWSLNVPTLEELAEWISIQAHAFVRKLLAPAGMKPQVNYLRAYTIDLPILRLLGVRYLITDATGLEGEILHVTSSGSHAAAVHLYELDGANVASYSPTRFVVATTADEIVRQIRENKTGLDVTAVVLEPIPMTRSRARDVTVTIERGGVDVHAASDGPAHVLLPIQYSHCLVVANRAPVRLRRANMMQTLMSFEGEVDAELRFRFGLFEDNSCRMRDAEDNRNMGLP